MCVNDEFLLGNQNLYLVWQMMLGGKSPMRSEKCFIYRDRTANALLLLIVGCQESLILGSLQSVIDGVPILNLLRQWLCMYLHMSAKQLSWRQLEELKNIYELLQQCE